MHKLVIMIEPLENRQAFEEGWPEFLHQVERMPGLQREVSSHVLSFLYGRIPYAQVHELYFDSLEEAQQAMSSPQGRLAGQLLQKMTGGHMALYVADHLEDDMDNIRKHQSQHTDAP